MPSTVADLDDRDRAASLDPLCSQDDLLVDHRLHVLHHVFIEGLVIGNAALAVHASQNRVVNAIVEIIHKFPEASLGDEVGGRFKFGLNVFEEYRIVKTVSAPEAPVGFSVMVVTLDEILHVVAFREIRADATLRV